MAGSNQNGFETIELNEVGDTMEEAIQPAAVTPGKRGRFLRSPFKGRGKQKRRTTSAVTVASGGKMVRYHHSVIFTPRWGKNPHFIQKFTCIENPYFYKSQNSEISFFTKFTFLK